MPGDVVNVTAGQIVPADLLLIDGEYLTVDQSALTGESLPVSKKVGDAAYSGGIAKQGNMSGVVEKTGNNTFFGRTAKLVASAGSASHSQKAVLQIGDFLILVAFATANRHVVRVSLDPFNPEDPWLSIQPRLFELMIAVAILGVIVCGCATWFGQRRWRRANSAHIAEKNHAYRQENRDRLIALDRERYWRDPEKARAMDIPKTSLDEASFRVAHEADEMARDKLAEGISGFSKAIAALEKLLG